MVASTLLFMFIAGYSLTQRRTPGAYSLFVMMTAALIWSLGSFFEITAQTLYWKLIWRNIQQIGVFVIPSATVYFAIDYTKQWQFLKLTHVLAILPLVSILLIFTNDYHHIMRVGYELVQSDALGQTLQIHSTVMGTLLVAYNFLLPINAVGLMINFWHKVSLPYRKQVTLIICCILFTFIISFVKVMVLDPLHIDIFMSVLYIPSALILFYSLFKYNFFSLSPIARDKVFEVIDQGILVMNKNDRIVDANLRARQILKDYYAFVEEPVGIMADDVFYGQPAIGELLRKREPDVAEFKMIGNDIQTYIVINYYPLRHKNNEDIGSVLIINNVTQQRIHEMNLQERADRDGLTKLLNRSGFHSVYNNLQHKIYEHAQPISVFMLDLDNFKQLNDTHGHPNGDLILVHFTNLLQESLRNEDIIGRIGGDEFAAILPNTHREDAIRIAERIRIKVAASKVSLPGGQIVGYTCSIGVTDNNQMDRDLIDILHEADVALYQAKHQHKNCAVLYTKAYKFDTITAEE